MKTLIIMNSPGSEMVTVNSIAPDALQLLRVEIRARYKQSEADVVAELLDRAPLSPDECLQVTQTAINLVVTLRSTTSATLMESFLAEYGLSTKEGIGLMCLAEALLRVPDAATIDELIVDKIEPSDWGSHLGRSSSSLVNASTWALMLTGRLLDDDSAHPAQEFSSSSPSPVLALRQLVRRLGEPLVRKAVSQSMKLLGRQFVLGQSIEDAVGEARSLESQGYTYSYDMLGEAARNNADALRYLESYSKAIELLASVAGNSVAERPGISVKLSALHPRYEYTQRDAVMCTLLPRVRSLAIAAADAGIGFNIDAEEADRLDLSLDIIEALIRTPALANWAGLGVVVQAYSRRALPVINWLIQLAKAHQRKLMVRLVKGAYWDAEIKQAQELGLASFPVFTRKASTDLSYIVCAGKLLEHRDCIYPQFATHNAHTTAAIIHMAGDDTGSYEFQRLHGMGESLHALIRQQYASRCRVYAPVGAHRDLLAYLVRRLLENGANSSFVHQIVNTSISPQQVARCPIGDVRQFAGVAQVAHPAIRHPLGLYQPDRSNSRGYRINDPASISALLEVRESFRHSNWHAEPVVVGPWQGNKLHAVFSPQSPEKKIGTVINATTVDAKLAIDSAWQAGSKWQDTPVTQRATCLQNAADLYENRIAEFCALTCLEAGKNLSDGIAEVREAVDFLRYYAATALAPPTSADQAKNSDNSTSPTTRIDASKSARISVDADARLLVDTESTTGQARGIIVCISPWNFPLAIFTGQLSAALVAGNTVIAKPAEQTPLVASLAIELLQQAGIPDYALQLVPGDGATIGSALTSDERIAGVCFTGSTEVARRIERSLANRAADNVVFNNNSLFDFPSRINPLLIAETGGINVMLADTTALTEQVVRDVLTSAFQSAGQRCSALRLLYVQEEALDRILSMLCGAIETLVIGDPWQQSTDSGPLIDAAAQQKISAYVAHCKSRGQLIKQCTVPATGYFIGPAIIQVSGIDELTEEIFGPILHVASYRAHELDNVIDAINAQGYGLTFGLHTRIDDRVQQVVERIRVGNVYVNRNQIGAVVGSQPFGGEGLSGTGPKAGGPNYVQRLLRPNFCVTADQPIANNDTPPQQIKHAHSTITNESIETALLKMSRLSTAPHKDAIVLPGPTGESNRLTFHPRGRVLVLGQHAEHILAQSQDALMAGCSVLAIKSALAATEQSRQLSARPQMQGSATPENSNAAEDLANSKLEEFAASHNRMMLIEGDFDAHCLSVLRGFDAVAASGLPQSIQPLRCALATRNGPILPLITSTGDPQPYLIERHLCIDTTASGGNATLLAIAD